jgi:anti-sigma regulatory factor (Ser/Thr protein kinase)
MTAARSFPAAPAAVALARAYAREQMQGSGSRVADMVELLVSELASNAVTHARTPFTVCVLRDDHQVRVEVADTGDGELRVRPLDPVASNGRGLQLLDALADNWGVDTADDGKTVWFSVS